MVGFADTDEAQAAVAASIRERRFAGARIGLDTNSYSMSAATFMRLSVLLPNASFIPMPGLSDSLPCNLQHRLVGDWRCLAKDGNILLRLDP
ncbi:hypothetical protein ACC771_13545, partial [Rhizobium ruizarguesonis]